MKAKVVLGISIIVVMSSIAGCVKKRPDMISPNHLDPEQFRAIPAGGEINAQLNAINDPALEGLLDDSKGHIIVTAAESTLGDLVEAATVRVNKGAGFNFPHYVGFQTNSPLLADNLDQIKLYGDPNSTYKVHYELTPKYLKIYKEVTEEQLTHYEKPYAQQKGDKWWVPLGGYSVTYFKRKKQVNADNRETNIVDFFSVAPENYKTATHYRYDAKSFMPFARVAKTNVYPFEYFTGEWYFATAVVSTRQGKESEVGYFDSSMDASLRGQATRIKFIRSKDFLRAVNTIIDSRTKVTDDQLSDAVNIPAKWFDYRVQMDGVDQSLAEEMFPANDFNQRQYVELDLKLVKSLNEDKSNTADYFRGIELSDVKFSKDTFSFTIHTVSSGVKRKYSFMRIKPTDFKERVYYKEDSKYFGLFSTRKFKLIDINSYGEGDVEKDILVNRFNPNKKIVFRFSTQTPKLAKGEKDVYGLNIDYRRIGHNATAYWNRVFELIGAKAQVVLDDSEDTELGDFEYNTINIITNLVADGSGGVGPTVVDPITGEIINGTVNIYVATSISSLSRDLNNVLNLERGLIQDTLFSKEIAQRPIMGGFLAEVKHFCPEFISYAHKTKKIVSANSVADAPYINACLEKLAPKRIEAITTHEMGHTLGLRHNFYGSYDKENSVQSLAELKSLFPPKDFKDLYSYIPSDKFMAKTSSSMDYFKYKFEGSNGLVFVTPSYADMYALAYAYSDAIPAKNNNDKLAFIKLNTAQNVKAASAQMRSFMYCTDEQAANRAKDINVLDPGCALMDYGQSYKEIMDESFNTYRDNIIVGLKRIGRQSITGNGNYRGTLMTSMARIYANWRYNLRSYLKDPNDVTLSTYTLNEYTQLMERIKSGNSKIAQDVGIADLYYKYMSEIINMSNYYCVTSNKKTKEINLREFNLIQEAYFVDAPDQTISSCSDDVVKQRLAQDYNEEVVTEFGLPVQNLQFSKKLEDAVDSVDIVGVGGDRVNAAKLLAVINPQILRQTAILGFGASVLSEPHIGINFKNKVSQRLFQGLDIADRVNYALELAGTNLKVEDGYLFKKYSQELPIVAEQLNSMVNSNVGVGGVSNVKELRDYNILSTQNRAEIPGGSNYVEVASVYYYAPVASRFANSFIDQYKKMKQPYYANLNIVSGGNDQVQSGFEKVLELVVDLPLETRDNYVLTLAEANTLISNLQSVMSKNRNDQMSQAEVMTAMAPYMPLVQKLSVYNQVSAVGFRTGEKTIDVNNGEGGVLKFNVSDVEKTLASIKEGGFTGPLVSEFQVTKPVTQYDIVSNYVLSKGSNVYNLWKSAVTDNVNFVNDFDEREAIAYRQFLESNVKMFSQVSITK